MTVSGQWVCLLSCIASYPSFPLLADWFQMCRDGPGWADADDSHQGQVLTVWGCVCCLLSSWLSFCFFLLFLSDESVHQWLMSPHRTWLIFHLQPASQLLKRLGAGPACTTNSSAFPQEQCGFQKVQCQIHPAAFHFLPVFLFDSKGLGCAFCSYFAWKLMLFFCVRPTFYCHSPEHRETKKHFLAAEAVIPCCQNSLYCRKLHLFLPSVVHWRPQRAQLCIFANQWNCVWLPMDQQFFFFLKLKVRKGWTNMFFFSLATDL